MAHGKLWPEGMGETKGLVARIGGPPIRPVHPPKGERKSLGKPIPVGKLT